MAFSAGLLDRAKPIREKVFGHPFVRGIGDGTLPVETFGFYMCQDYVFLIDYCRVLALAVAKGQDLATMDRFANLLHATLGVEMELHRGYAAEFGISREELERTEPGAATHAYTRHLLGVAWSGTVAEIAASLLPCQWGYWELGQQLAAEGKATEANRYRRWIEAYSSPEFGDLALWLRGLVDAHAEGARPDHLARMEQEFLASSRYELMFWEMAWQRQSWAV